MTVSALALARTLETSATPATHRARHRPAVELVAIAESATRETLVVLGEIATERNAEAWGLGGAPRSRSGASRVLLESVELEEP